MEVGVRGARAPSRARPRSIWAARILGVLLLLVLLASVHSFASADECDKCGPTRLIGCRSGRCYYKCIRRCLGKDNKFYYEAVKFNYAGQ